MNMMTNTLGRYFATRFVVSALVAPRWLRPALLTLSNIRFCNFGKARFHGFNVSPHIRCSLRGPIR